MPRTLLVLAAVIVLVLAMFGGPALATWIVDWDRRLTMSRRFQVIRVEDGVTLLRAGMRFACIELSTGRPRRLPKEFVEGYGPAVLREH